VRRTPAIEEIRCKSALTGSGGDYRLNPYVGCQHACTFCYATFIARWKRKTAPWGSWVQVKRNMPDVLRREMRRRRGIRVFISTVCDAYQPAERRYRVTRGCLGVLREAAERDPALRLFLLTRSDLVLRDLEILREFPRKAVEVAFSISTVDDETARRFEPRSPRPSRRREAAQALRNAGLRVGFLINPILPFVTERDMPELLRAAAQARADFVGFDTLNYVRGHVGGRLRPIYQRLGRDPLERFEEARRDPRYPGQLRALIRKLARKYRSRLEIHPYSALGGT
jgi:DNA repair photolyase